MIITGMQHIKVTFATPVQETADMLIALLSAAGFDGFEETDNELLAYVAAASFDPEEVATIAGMQGVDYKTETIESQNWNALWESNFQPVVVAGLCTIRAHFHTIAVTTPYEIVITPKMSFGTGHHATTQLMMMLMAGMDMKGKSVIDFGTGTGVLAILAEMLGAAPILAIDNDSWSVENAIENTQRNNCKHITVQQASLEDIADGTCSVLLANINRHILLDHMPALYNRLNHGGTILMSGLLVADQEIILDAATAAGFKFDKVQELNGWIAMLFDKK